METIKISQESLDAFKKEKNLIPAPFDEKNASTDWIQDVFDNESCVWNDKTAVGFINDNPAIVAWSGNILLWKFPLATNIEDSGDLSELRDRLKRYDEDPDNNFITKDTIAGNLLIQKFYWKNED